MRMLYVEGPINVNSFEQRCRQNGLEPNKVVFLFPGNDGHHGPQTTLFSIKSGGGLASLAGANGQKGYPVLSLPTTSMEQWANNMRQQGIVRGAIEDLYRALGAGYNFMLPIREHPVSQQSQSTPVASVPVVEDEEDCFVRAARYWGLFGYKTNAQHTEATYNSMHHSSYTPPPCYFSNGLKHFEGQKEPSFWGGIQAASNIALADHYIAALDQFQDFIALSDVDQYTKAKENADQPLFAAYLEGKAMPADDPWLQAVDQKQMTRRM